MHPSLNPGRAALSTRLAFFVVGLAPAAWAPLIPFVKAKLGLDDALLGLLLLCLGAGSIAGMPVTGVLMPVIGPKRAILIGGALFVALLPALVLLDDTLLLGLALALFGAAIGTTDVAMNLQAVVVEREAGRPMMSGFHGQYSLGGIAGAAGTSLILLLAPSRPVLAAGVMSVIGLALLVVAAPGLLPRIADDAANTPLLVMPRGLVLFIGLLCFLCFMAEGSVLDWSAVFLGSVRGAGASLSGLGFATFAGAMTIGRLAGDSVRAAVGERLVLLAGGLVATAGFVVALAVPSPRADLFGFFLVGLGASNLVPVLITVTGRTRTMPPGLAIAAITTLGYAGVLAGPPLIGLVARETGLSLALLLPALGVLTIAASFAIGEPRRRAGV